MKLAALIDWWATLSITIACGVVAVVHMARLVTWLFMLAWGVELPAYVMSSGALPGTIVIAVLSGVATVGLSALLRSKGKGDKDQIQ